MYEEKIIQELGQRVENEFYLQEWKASGERSKKEMIGENLADMSYNRLHGLRINEAGTGEQRNCLGSTKTRV